MIEVRGEASRLNEVIGFLERDVIPAARHMDGFCGGQWLLDRGDGSIVGVALWQTLEDLEASAEAMRRFRERGAELLGGEVLSTRVFEVIAEAKSTIA